MLHNFYRTVRPWGIWGPVLAEVQAQDPTFQPNRNFKRNAFNIVLGIIAQLCLTILPMYLMLSQHVPLLVVVVVLIIVLSILKKPGGTV
ncbi:MAG: hypothetical protein WKG07_36730 [Hymenobacter sp.]